MATPSQRAFRAQLGVFVEHVKDQHVKWVRKVAESAHRAAYTHTPIDTSRAMSGWTASVDSAFLGEPKFTAGSKGSTLAEAIQINETNIKETAEAYRFGKKLYIRNNVPYIEILDSGDGSRQAPKGMMPFALDAAKQEMK
jgi:hypothetical protein